MVLPGGPILLQLGTEVGPSEAMELDLSEQFQLRIGYFERCNPAALLIGSIFNLIIVLHEGKLIPGGV